MNNLHEMEIKQQIKKQQEIVDSQLERINKITNCVINSENYESIIDNLDEKKMQDVIANGLTTLNINIKKGLNLQTINLKNKKELIGFIYPIPEIIAKIKSIETNLILAQNKCALKGEINKADKLAKLSLELNYENHKFMNDANFNLKEIINLEK